MTKSMDGWIGVKDRLPINEGKVLMVFYEQFFGIYAREIECGYYDEESEAWRFWRIDREVEGPGVEWWMPLPELPIEKELKDGWMDIQNDRRSIFDL